MQPLRSVNLNLIPILRELLRKRNVTRAAASLNMSQSAVSEALSRLRHLFDDEILIPDGRTFRLSALAERMRPVLEGSLGQLESLLHKRPFEPAETEGSIKIATVDYLVMLFGERLVRRVAELAPKVTLHFSDLDAESVSGLLKGYVDFVIGTPVAADARIESRLLAEQDAVCIVASHSRVAETMTEDEFWNARHVAFSPGDDASLSLHASVLRSLGREEFNAVLVQNFLLLPYLVQASDNMVAILARPHAEEAMKHAAIRIVELPFAFPKVRITAFWERARKVDPMVGWFLQILVEVTGAEHLLAHTDESLVASAR
jgi:LysR family nod box-dependent transcriptional activator